MSNSLLFAFVVFAVVMFFTPGPNNIMLLSSGLTYGFRRTVPHIAGITVGFAFMVGAVGVGLGAVFIAYPVLQTILKYGGVAYLLYLAAVIAMAEPPSADKDDRPGREALHQAELSLLHEREDGGGSARFTIFVGCGGAGGLSASR